MNSERKEKLISRISAVKNKADLKTLLENAVRIHGDLENPEIQKAISEAQAGFAREAAAARKKAAAPVSRRNS
jgi:hypothetical protein